MRIVAAYRILALAACPFIGVGCEDDAAPAIQSPDARLIVTIPSTDQRPYTLKLPNGWSVEETVHSDGSSFVVGPMDPQGEAQGGGKVYGIVEPSGRIVPFTSAPNERQIASIEADGSEVVSLDETITVDGLPAWEMLISTREPPVVAIMAGVDVGGGAGFTVILTAEEGSYSTGLLKAIVQSIEIDNERLAMTLMQASEV